MIETRAQTCVACNLSTINSRILRQQLMHHFGCDGRHGVEVTEVDCGIRVCLAVVMWSCVLIDVLFRYPNCPHPDVSKRRVIGACGGGLVDGGIDLRCFGCTLVQFELYFGGEG